MNFLKGLTTICVISFVGLMLFSCTPGKAQTRGDGYYNRNSDSYSAESADNRDNRNYNDKYYTEESASFDNESYADNKYKHDDSYRGRTGQENSDDMTYSRESKRTCSPQESKFYQTGYASWYGREFHGKVTASGEKFNMYELTAAHKTLPFGTIARIKNLDNGREATIRVNDRGPYRGNRIMDLSYDAAKKLDILAAGKAQVGISIIKMGDDKYYSEKSPDSLNGRYVEPVVHEDLDADKYAEQESGRYSIQAGAFYSKRNAINLQQKIERLTGKTATIVDDNDLYKVRIDGFSSKWNAAKYKRMLADDDIPSFITESIE